MNKKILLSLAIFCAAVPLGFAQTEVTQVDWFNNAATLFRDAGGTALTQGNASLNSDGALIQLGYFSAGTAANNFAGNWIPITGFGAASPRTAIGDSPDLSGAGDGRIGFSTVFRNTSNLVQVFDPTLGDTGAYITQSSITITTAVPPSGQVLAIRFYNNNTGTGSYNTVSSDNWTWISPTDAGSNVLLNLVSANTNGTLEFESFPAFGAAGNFRTVIAIPEPSTYALLLVGLAGVLFVRRRAKTVA
jgi:hypothetical protein